MTAKLKVLEPETTETPQPEPLHYRDVLSGDLSDRVDALCDALDVVRWQKELQTGDELAALRETEARLLEDIAREPYRYAIVRAQVAIARGMESKDKSALTRNTIGQLEARRDQARHDASRAKDDIDRRVETSRADALDREIAALRDRAESDERNNVLTETERKIEARVSELQAELHAKRKNLDWQLSHKNDSMVDRGTGVSGRGEDFAERSEERIGAIEAEIVETENALQAEKAKIPSLTDIHTWPRRVINEMGQTVQAVYVRLERRRARIALKV